MADGSFRNKANRATIADVAKAAGVSVSTVDRVLNGRLPVRTANATRVRMAAEEIGFHAAALIRQRSAPGQLALTLGFILQRHSEQFYNALGEALTAATVTSPDIRGRPLVEYLDDLRPAIVADRLQRMCERADAVALVAADHPHITRAIAEARERGKPVVALLSDLSAPARSGYVGLDWRKTGRTAGWAMTRIAGRIGRVAIIIGSPRYLATELCEISFRSYLREHAPDLQLLEPLVNFEEPRLAYQGTLDLVQRTSDLVGIYMVGGGVEGVMDALREAGAAKRIALICHDLTENTREGLISGVLDFVIHQPRTLFAAATVQVLRSASVAGAAAAALQSNEPPAIEGTVNHSPTHTFIPMELYTAENV